MNTSEILSNNMSLAILNMADLKELFLNWQEEMNQKPLKVESPLLTPDEVASKYRISKVTLWRWAKDGLLKPVKMGESLSIVSRI